MKMLKKVTALALGLAMLIGMCAVQAEEACGLTCGAAAEMLLAAMDEHPDPDSAALLQDPLCGALDPQAEITRVQALRMLNRAFGELSAPEGDSARMVDPAALPTDIPEDAAAELADLLAAGIGNVHGAYPADWAGLDFSLLGEIRRVTGEVPLVLHGGSGIPEAMIREAILLGICKINVNTECREAFDEATCRFVREGGAEADKHHTQLITMAHGLRAVKARCVEKMRLFGCIGKA